MKNPFTHDTAVLEALRSGASLRVNTAIEHLYRNEKIIGAVRQQVMRQGGDESDVRDMLNQALVVFLNHVENNTYKPELSAIATYIATIAKQKFFTQRRSEKRLAARHDRSAEAGHLETTTNPEVAFDRQHRKVFVHKLLGMIGEKCGKLLLLKQEGYQMAEIAEKLSYKNADSAKSAHAECRKKLNDVAQRPEVLQELREL